jgi:alpha-beta hydrolase superfamily lysophospholipase
MGAVAGMLIAATDSRRLAGLVLTAPFVPAARNGRSTVATAVDYARHPAWQVALTAGAGHFPHRDDPAAWLATVDPWLRALHAR